MTWKDALIKLENTINTYNLEINSIKNEKSNLEFELKKLKEETRPSVWKQTYNQKTHNQVFINRDGNILLYDNNAKMASFYELHHREFMFDIDKEIYAPIEKAYSYSELVKMAKTYEIECKKVYKLKKEIKDTNNEKIYYMQLYDELKKIDKSYKRRLLKVGHEMKKVVKLHDFCNNILDKFYEDEIEVYDALNKINEFMKANGWRKKENYK